MAIVNSRLREQYAHLHSRDEYGDGAERFCLHIQACISDLKPDSILDYGCGQSLLQKGLELGASVFCRYDPAIPDVAELPIQTADLLINTDVLEHVPHEDLRDLLKHMSNVSENVFFNIATRKASQILPNGQNAHCTVMNAGQWLTTIREFFPRAELVADHPGHSCLIITWNSPVLPVLAGIERLRIVERQCDEYRQNPVRKLRRRVRRLLNWVTSTPVPRTVLFPDTRRIGEA